MALTPSHDHWYSDIQEPLEVSSDTDIKWNYQCDVLVIGLGAAGICAAIEASENGAQVIGIDRFQGGGDSCLSGGIVYAGATRFQREAGFDDSAENMFAYLRQETQGVVHDKTLKRFCCESNNDIEWLEKNGVVFSSNLSPQKTSYPASKYFLYYSGNEQVPSYAKTSVPAPRGHRAVGQGLSGEAFYRPLYDSALNKGMKLLSQARVTRFVRDSSAKVLGVELQMVAPHMRKLHRQLQQAVDRRRMYAPSLVAKYRKKIYDIEQMASQVIYVSAAKGIILSCGGFAMNRKMLQHYAPKYSAAMALGTTGAMGSGMRLGQTLGADSARLNNISAWRFLIPPASWIKGMLINAEGQRYINEQCYGAAIGHSMCEDHQGTSYLILNRALFRRALREALPFKLWMFQSIPIYLCMLFSKHKASSIQKLAKRINIPEDRLSATLENYNRAAAAKCEDEFGKPYELMQCMNKGPYYALNVSIDNKWFPLPAISLGGLKVDENTGLIKTMDDKTISNVYAAGRTAVGIASNMYVSGLSLADCVFSGRRAGRHAALKL